GDLSGLGQAGEPHPKIDERISAIGMDNYTAAANPVVYWDVYGEKGHPVRATVSDMGPTLLSRLLDLNETQEGVLNIAFRFADDEGLLILDLKDLQATLKFVGENARQFRDEYGNVSSASVGAIQRRLLVIEEQGADLFFGEPALSLWDFMRVSHNGQGNINVLAADKLMENPRLYATFLLWLLSELFEELPEVGDQDKPRFVFFFDEAHLLFNDAPKALLEKVETVVRLIRSKGVGIYFISQSPLDIPDSVLSQLGNRVQHALRAFTPRDQKAVKTTAETMRANPNFKTVDAITQLGVGEALVSTLGEDGIPGIVEKTLVCPPQSRIGPASSSEREQAIKSSPLMGRYDTAVDRESAYEKLQARAQQHAETEAEKSQQKPRGRRRQSVGETFMKSMARSIASRLATRIVRGVLGSIMR
ncbi:MAG TPA: ATP-binding protein, partial [Gammaproteobacteria bacterium]|nr:ATP-binding protein [Gammaproteobacteria bacterium]